MDRLLSSKYNNSTLRFRSDVLLTQLLHDIPKALLYLFIIENTDKLNSKIKAAQKTH